MSKSSSNRRVSHQFTVPSKMSTAVENVEEVEDVAEADDGRNISDIVISDAVISIPATSRRVARIREKARSKVVKRI